MSRMLTNSRWRIALIIALVTGFAGILLVGVSSWFLGAVALAGLTPMAFAFNFHAPAALVRLLALLRTAGKYGERMVGHDAALHDQASSRRALFEGMAAAPDTRAGGWQLARADRLDTFLADVETRDNARLRATFPWFVSGATFLTLSIVAVAAEPLALPFILGIAASVILLVRNASDRAGRFSEEAREERRKAGLAFGLALGSVAGLEADGRRDRVMSDAIEREARATRLLAKAERRMIHAEQAAGLFGVLAAASVLLAAAMAGKSGHDMLPSLFLAFSWLAFGELAAPIARQFLAAADAKEADTRLRSWQAEPAPEDTASPLPERCRLPFVAPNGVKLAESADLLLRKEEPVAILGSSGCGKTTAIKRLAGWLPWTEARHPFGSEEAARRATHLSLHDAAIRKATVRANLFSDAPDHELLAAIDAVELTPRIREAGGLDAMISQEILSLGEARRFAIARAMLAPQPVILLDEPGEHLRPEQARRILARILDALRDRVVVYVTHDEALAQLAHREIRVDG
ncbi:ATP-binding cassette domain-containing protein [Parvularcula sp. ZS-1/3]|uniref:ATP-binding cassette domain-containing protein n=1 Tax=Parvularcula mediterranea TaxID=2732508 RepID=A0A7Y3W5D7_9PROT|nr:ATP-binding cassette domain-containing protein [Parvularcula mediterranea]NNU16161.1 ATP-binding cassette domain-containing protein [Parvularcula mediterranea]